MKEKIPEPVQTALALLRGAGYRTVPVGGCVRDLLMGRAPYDWDVATAATPDEMKRVFSAHPTLETGIRHGTLTVLLGGVPVEITAFRTDGGYPDGRHPERVTFSRELSDDLARRDFTVNALCLDEDGSVIDLFGGREDLKNGVIRCVGDPDRRFAEDALRILRALRFAAQLGFSIEPDTAAALRRHAGRLSLLSAERVFSELTRLLCAPDAVRVLLEQDEVLFAALPQLAPMKGLCQREDYHCYDVWEHTARSVGAIAPEPLLRWTMLLHDTGKPDCADGAGHFYGHPKRSAELAREILGALRASNGLRDGVTALVSRHDLPLSAERLWLRRWLSRLGEETLRRLIAVARADSSAQQPDVARRRARELDGVTEALDALLAQTPPMGLCDLAVSGRELIGAGIPPGRKLGEILRALLEAVVEERLPNDAGALLEAALRLNRQ